MNSTVTPAVDPLADMDLGGSPSLEPTQTLQVVVADTRSQLEMTLTTIKKPGSLIDISQIDAAEMAEIKKAAESVSLDSQQSVEGFAYDPQLAYSANLSRLLGESTIGDAGMTDFIANDLQLSTTIVQEAMTKLSGKDERVGTVMKFVRSLPFVGTHVTTAEVLLESKEKLIKVFERLETGVNNKLRVLEESDVKLDLVARDIKANLYMLRRYIVAGEIALLEMCRKFAEELRQIPANPDPMKFNELLQKRDLGLVFESHLVGLGTAYVKAATLLPKQFQNIKRAGFMARQNLRSTMVLAIPDLKVSAIQLVALGDIQSSNKQNESIRTQRDIAAKQAQELLGTVLIESVKQQGDVLDEVKRLASALADIQEVEAKVQEMAAANAVALQQSRELQIESQNGFVAMQRATAQKFLELTGPKA